MDLYHILDTVLYIVQMLVLAAICVTFMVTGVFYYEAKKFERHYREHNPPTD